MCLTHEYRLVRDTGSNLYWLCSKCGKRRVTHCEGGYQPIDEQWLQTGVFSEVSKPPKAP